MKKIFFSTIIMVLVSFIVTSCGPKAPEPVVINDHLTAFAQLDKANNNNALWGLRVTQTGQVTFPARLIEIPKIEEGFIVGKQGKEHIIFDATNGDIVVQGLICSFETSPADPELHYILIDNQQDQSAYLIKDKKKVGPKKFIRIGASIVFYQDKDENLGILNFDNTEIISTPQKELIYIIQSKIVKKKSIETIYYAGLDANKIWTLYTADGKSVKKLNNAQIKKLKKDATEDEILKGFFYTTTKNI